MNPYPVRREVSYGNAAIIGSRSFDLCARFEAQPPPSPDLTLNSLAPKTNARNLYPHRPE